jgi:hypothetical protein
MALGSQNTQPRFENPAALLGDRLAEGSLYRLMADHGHEMFPDDYFADLYSDSAKGRPTVPARVVATTMVLQAFEGLSDREAADRLAFDLRWQAAAGVDTAAEPFHPTVLVGMRNRLRSSARPRRLFEDTKAVAKSTGALKNRARVLDSTPVYDAVATQDTVTQLRAGIRKVLCTLDNSDASLAASVRSVLVRDDDYATPGKPPCDWDDPAAREELVDALVKDARAALAVLDGAELSLLAHEAADLLALVAGQDVEEGGDGVFRIADKVARDRVISTVDTEARHGHKSRNRHFDGYKAHVAVDPDSELISEVTASAGNAPDREAVTELVAEHVTEDDKPDIVGDSAYAQGATLFSLCEMGFTVITKCPPIRNATGLYTKDRFIIDLDASIVTCPAGNTVAITYRSSGAGRATFRPHCSGCPLKSACTRSPRGRTIAINAHEEVLAHHRDVQREPGWAERYRADRPVVERKISHFTHKSWGGRKARTRGIARISTDLYARASAINWARLAILGLTRNGGAWVLAAT